ncbi:Putative serine protease HtrA [Gimesia alba]|uniref:Serine protease HtrA n=1 Tax=Gimesia alba TaxID=2527973 RepID=A0A517RBB6_9PLAN|nr:S1C family serine protease [Gimesia alba]QDT41169.1 Putative serine protease HtrA [Gimesia alba]
MIKQKTVKSVLVYLCLVGSVLAVPLTSQASSQSTIKYALPRIVKIFGAGGVKNLYGYSTGFLVSPEGHIATIWSPVLDTDRLSVVLHDGRKFEAEVLGAEPHLDLAIIKLKSERELNLPCFHYREKTIAGPGTRILGFSNMFRVATGDEPVSVLHGVIEARTDLPRRRGAFELSYSGDVYVVDAITNNPGAAGGAILTYDGKLLGMIGKQVRNAKTNTWVNYSLPIDVLSKSIEQIITGKFDSSEEKKEPETTPERYRPVDFGLIMVPDVLYRTPAYIDSVLPDSLVAKAGLQPNDLVVFVNDELIKSCKTLKTELGKLETGDLLRLVVRRNNQLVSVEFQVPPEKK